MLKRFPHVAALCGLVVPLFAQSATEAPVDTTAMLTALRALREKQAETAKTSRSKLIADFQSRAVNPAAAVDFYLAAVKATQFDGEARGQTLFVEWKKKEAAHLKSRDFQNGLRLHLNYLVLTLQRAGGAEVKTLIPALVSHVQQVRIEQDAGNTDGILKGKIEDSIFVRWYQIGGLISGLENWEMSPGNADGIYQKIIQPELRRQKDPHITDNWDAKIAREATQAAKSTLAYDTGKFDQVRKPALLWNRAEDVFSIGQKNRAVTDMFAIIKAYPSHPDAMKWMTRIEDILTGKAEANGAMADADNAAPAN